MKTLSGYECVLLKCTASLPRTQKEPASDIALIQSDQHKPLDAQEVHQSFYPVVARTLSFGRGGCQESIEQNFLSTLWWHELILW